MPAFHRVFSKLWTDREFRSWSSDARLAAVYLLTCPHRNTEGLFRLPMPFAQHDLRWPAEQTEAAFRELEAAGFIVRDREVDLVWIVDALAENRPVGPKQIKGAVNRLSEVPASILMPHYLAKCSKVCPTLAEAIRERLPWWETVSEQYPRGFDTPSIPQAQSQAQSLTQAQAPLPPDGAPEGDPEAGELLLLVQLSDRIVQRALVDPEAVADDTVRDLVSGALANGHTELDLQKAADDTSSKTELAKPEAYLRKILARLADEPASGRRPTRLTPARPDPPPLEPLPPPRSGDPDVVAAARAAARASVTAGVRRSREGTG